MKGQNVHADRTAAAWPESLKYIALRATGYNGPVSAVRGTPKPGRQESYLLLLTACNFLCVFAESPHLPGLQLAVGIFRRGGASSNPFEL